MATPAKELSAGQPQDTGKPEDPLTEAKRYMTTDQGKLKPHHYVLLAKDAGEHASHDEIGDLALIGGLVPFPDQLEARIKSLTRLIAQRRKDGQDISGHEAHLLHLQRGLFEYKKAAQNTPRRRGPTRFFKR